jgi:glutamate/tyrosine decarboxylase-like PLP-dependent enzyme
VRALLDRAHRRDVPVLAVVGVLGTTEFGTIDPIHELVALRARCAERGQAFALHVDAAWGGYLTTMFREPDGGVTPHAALRERFRYFPSRRVYDAFAALGAADSVTVDPHKLGYLPYAAGAFVARDRRVAGFVVTRPPYLYEDRGAEPVDPMRHLGQYILEGSKPGAAAAAACVTHRVVPLDRDHFGRLCAQTMDACELLFDRLRGLAARLAPVCRVVLPVEPDTNLCCVALNPVGNRSLAAANAFTRAVYARLAPGAGGEPVQAREFFGSFTSLLRRNLRAPAVREIETALGVARGSFTDRVFLLRHTLMNPWLTHAAEPGGENYVDRYCAFLERAIRAELAARVRPAKRR